MKTTTIKACISAALFVLAACAPFTSVKAQSGINLAAYNLSNAHVFP